MGEETSHEGAANAVDAADSDANGAATRTVEIEGVKHNVAEFTDADLFEARAAERESKSPYREGDDVSWAELRGMGAQQQEAEEDPATDWEAEAERVAALPAEDRAPSDGGKRPWKKIKNPEARERILMKERQRLEEKVERLTALVEKQLAPAQEEDGEVPPDPQISPVAAIMHKLEETQRELREIKEREAQKEQLAEARAAIHESNTYINTRLEADPVFKGAFDHLTKVVLNNVRDDPRFGATEQERRVRAVEQLIRKQLEWHRDGLDPVEKIYDQAMKFGYDPDAMMERLGGYYDGNGNWVGAAPQQAPQPQQRAQPKPKSPVEKIAASRARTAGTASLANVVGSPPVKKIAKRLQEVDDEKFNYEIRKAIDTGELRPAKGGQYSWSLRDVLEGSSAVFDDGL